MSSPCVTGVVALLLEANPNLSPSEIKEILKNTARQDDKTGVLPVTGSTQWGWGKVTATRAINEAVRLVGIELPIEDQLVVYPNPSSNVLFVDGTQCILDATKNIYSTFSVVLAASNQTGEEGKGTFFFLLFLFCFFLMIYSNFTIAFNFPVALVAPNQTGEWVGWQGRTPPAGRRTVAGAARWIGSESTIMRRRP